MSDGTGPTNPPPEAKKPYDLEPDPVVPPQTGTPRPTKVGDAGLLDDFDEDADFDRDPEVERVVKGPAAAAAAPPAPNEPAYVKPGWCEPQQLALIATGVLLAGVIAACVTRPGRWYATGASALYSAVLHTVTGVAAIAVAAHLSQMRLGSLPLAAARMFMAVSVFALIFHLNIPIQGRSDEVVLACAAYVGVIWGLFRLSGERLFILVSIHAGLWLVIWLSAVLHTWAVVTPAAPAPAP